ncbi:FAD-dependent oxidoreductase [Bradyrhizobium sp. U531]|uniref:FAD-dependent oxidoreductase n=1 Tax=Bradyrhizobium sp. U531 TaxID=3053458 RepID=UPI003F43E551
MRSKISALEGTSYDVAIIGAGINGTSCAVELAERGFSVLLVDKADFGSGSSSRSSRFLHCGLRWLAYAKSAHGFFEKVRTLDAARKVLRFRRAMRTQTPSRVRGHTFLIPIFAEDIVPGWQFDLAFATLAVLSGFRGNLNYRRYSANELGSLPLLKHIRLQVRGVVSFTDYVYDWPERICVDLALSAEESGAIVRNYTNLRKGRQSMRGWELELADSLAPEQTAKVSARLLLNMTGVWSDQTSDAVGIQNAKTVTPNKGCHIMVQLPREFAGMGIICPNSLGHVFMCVPWRGLHILGPTETAYSGSPDELVVDTSDVDLLLQQANAVIPGISLTADDVRFRWAGLRPATFEEGNPLGVWRRAFHDLSPNPSSPMIGVSWGTINSYDDTVAIAARLVEAKLGVAKISRHRPPTRRSEISHEADLSQIIATQYPVSVADVLFRRTGHGWDPDLGLGSAESVAKALADQRNGMAAGKLMDEYHALLRREFGHSGKHPN